MWILKNEKVVQAFFLLAEVSLCEKKKKEIIVPKNRRYTKWKYEDRKLVSDVIWMEKKDPEILSQNAINLMLGWVKNSRIVIFDIRSNSHICCR